MGMSIPLRKRPAAANTSEAISGITDLHAFVERLQAQVADLTKRLESTQVSPAALRHQGQGQTLAPPTAALSKKSTPSPPALLIPAGMAGLDSMGTPVRGLDTAAMTLPSHREVMPAILVFLESFNAVMPLFEPKTLLKLVNAWYDVPHQRDPVSWAAINVVLALAYKQNLAGSSDLTGGEDVAFIHLSRAQSAISAVVLGDTALLNVQILLAMIILLQASKDLKPSLILIASAMRLAHELGLHTSAATSHLDSVTARQHSYVFFIAYILDKDLSMRARQPSIQRDDDIDIDMPTPAAGHDNSLNRGDEPDHDVLDINAGVVNTLSGDASVNYFLARIRLASIQGGIYDYLYSARSQSRSTSERAVAYESLVQALEQWQLSIPPEFAAALAPQNLSPASLPFFCILHATSFACVTMINQAHAWDEQWVQSLRNACKQSGNLPLPSRWEALVQDAHDFLKLFEAVPRGYGLVW